MNDAHNWGSDFALYFHQAQGIVKGHFDDVIVLISYALQHSSYDTFIPELYPWGWLLLTLYHKKHRPSKSLYDCI